MTNKTTNPSNSKNLAKSPQPVKLAGNNMAGELDMTRANPAHIQQMVQQREMRNNSTMAIASGNLNGTQSVLSQNNAMSVTKRHH